MSRNRVEQGSRLIVRTHEVSQIILVQVEICSLVQLLEDIAMLRGT